MSRPYLNDCLLYDKALLSTIYDCALRVSEACSLKWIDISFERRWSSSIHILPDHFVRIRHYGILSPCNREKLRSIQRQLDVPPVPKERKKKSYLEICNEKGWNIGSCETCCCQRLIMRIIKPAPRAPPYRVWHIGD